MSESTPIGDGNRAGRRAAKATRSRRAKKARRAEMRNFMARDRITPKLSPWTRRRLAEQGR